MGLPSRMREKISPAGKAMLLCIFHKEKTPSLRIWPDGGFLCFGCGQMGWIKDHFQLQAKYEALSARLREEIGQLTLPLKSGPEP